MAKTNSNPFTQAIKTPGIIIPATVTLDVISTAGVVTAGVLGTSGPQLVVTAGANDSVVKSLVISSNDTAAAYVHIWRDNAGSTPLTLIGTVAIPLASGASATGAVINVDIFKTTSLAGLQIDQSGRQTIPLAAGTKLYVGLVANITANKALWVSATVEDY
jgi:hypothetical protein